MLVISDTPQGSPEWFEERLNKCSGSNAYILLTKTLKAAIKENNKTSNFTGYWARRGKILEKQAIDVYSRINDVDVVLVGTVFNTTYPNAICSPDGIKGDTLLEVKCFKDINSIKSVDDIPMKVMAQLQFNMMICELYKSELILFNPDEEDINKCFRTIRVYSDYLIQANMANRLQGL